VSRQTIFGFPLTDVIKVLEMNGYVVRHTKEARHEIAFSRTHPLPPYADFPREALERIRRQITVGHLKFETHKFDDVTPGLGLPDTITSAHLFVL
jgi:hypothetical protein